MENATIGRRIYSMGKTTLCFIVFLICIQPLILCYFVVSITRSIWRNILIVKNPQLEFVKRDNLQSVCYTPRNPGIVNIILHLQGEPNIDAVRDAVSRGVLQRKSKSGELVFPKLSANLVTSWGHYAWKMNADLFNARNHITFYPSQYRGRPITDANVQDYISNIVSKYLPPGLPPWQICVIPMTINPLRSEDVTVASTSQSSEIGSDSSTQQKKLIAEQYYVIVRMHHLLISEEPDLRLNDLLPIESITSTIVASNLNSRSELEVDRKIPKSPLANILPYPVYIPQLYLRIQIGLTNCWNEFISKYDSYVGKPAGETTASFSLGPSISTNEYPERNNEDEKGAKTPAVQNHLIETLPQLFAVLLISYVTIAIDFYKGFYATKHHPMIKLKFLNNLINREIRKRTISWECVWQATYTSLHPISMTKLAFEWICWGCVAISIMWPHLIFRELQAFRCCFFQGYSGYPDTVTGFLFAYIPLLYNTVIELMQWVKIFVQAPRFIYEELIEIHRSDEHVLQNISLCGRKVLSWSNKISVTDVHRACIQRGVSPTELYMSATSATIMELLHEYDSKPVPKQIRVFATYRQHDYLYGKLNNDDNATATGHLCLILPMEEVSRKQLAQIRTNFRTARDNQVGIYFLFFLHKRFNVLTKFLPAVWTVIIFNYLSRRFSVSVSEITKNSNPIYQRTMMTCWGHTILDALFFSPPQSNGSASLSIQQFGDSIQLGVITDAQIHPLHMKLSEGWNKNLEKLF